MVSELTEEDFKKFNNTQGNIIENIQDIQKIEIELYKELEANVSNNGSKAERDIYLARIEKLSEIRMDMYRNIMDNYEDIRKTLNTTNSELSEKLILIDVVQQQLDSLRRQTSELNQEKTGKKRMIDINNYYGKKYMAQKELMQMIIITSVPLLALALLTKFGKVGLKVASVFGGVILLFGLYFIIRKWFDISIRTNYNFDEYDWGFKAPEQEAAFEVEPAETEATSLNLGSCVGQACCTKGMTYDEVINKCVSQPKNVEQGTTEQGTTEQGTKSS